MSNSHPATSLPWWVLLIAITCTLLLTAGAIIAGVRPGMLAGARSAAPGQEINEAVRVYAGYLVSRNLAIAVMLLGAMLMRARRALGLFMMLAAVVQFLDAGMNCLEGRWTLVPGVLVLGILLFAGANRLGFWRES